MVTFARPWPPWPSRPESKSLQQTLLWVFRKPTHEKKRMETYIYKSVLFPFFGPYVPLCTVKKINECQQQQRKLSWVMRLFKILTDICKMLPSKRTLNRSSSMKSLQSKPWNQRTPSCLYHGQASRQPAPATAGVRIETQLSPRT